MTQDAENNLSDENCEVKAAKREEKSDSDAFEISAEIRRKEERRSTEELRGI